MTLIAAFASPEFAVIVADRRRTQLITGIQIDDVKKICQLNDNVAVGFAGIYQYIGNGHFKGMAEHIINDCAYLIKKQSTIEDVAQIFNRAILARINAGVPKEDLEITYHIAGISSSGGYGLARVSCFEEFEPVITYPPVGGITWGLSRAEYCPSMWLESQIIAMKEISVKTTQQLAIELVKKTAEQDGFVSDTYDMLTLEFVGSN